MGSLNDILKGRWTIWILALFFSLLAGFGVLTILGSAADRIPYYVLAASVDARVQITPDMVKEVDAPADTVPANTVTIDQISSGKLFTLIPLEAGTVVSSSVVGNLKPLTADLPAGYVLSSILVSPENAVGGRIKRGDFIDIAAVTGNDTSAKARVVLQHVLVVDVTVAPSTIAKNATSKDLSTTPGADSPALYGGIPQLYTLAVTAQDFARLALLRGADMYLAISAAKTPDSMDVMADGSTLFLGGAVKPSYATSSVSSATPEADPTKAAVESFYAKYGTKPGYTVSVVGDYLQAVDNATKEVTDSVSLGGGTFDVVTGKWTSGN